jgi:putative ABC transport system substrate-binding protein
LLQQLVPDIQRVAFVFNPTQPGNQIGMVSLRRNAPALGIQMVEVPVQDPADLDNVLAFTAASQVQAMDLNGDPIFNTQMSRIAAFAVSHGIATCSTVLEGVSQGCLLAYSPTLTAIYRRLSYYVDRLLRGAKPLDLPIEQPTQHSLFVNATTSVIFTSDRSAPRQASTFVRMSS